MQGAAAEITLDDVLRAGRVLFGPAFAVEGRGWRDVLKATYRRRAMETHPDRARSIGRSERELAREFKNVADAYRVLSALGAAALPRRSAPVTAPAPRAPPPPQERPSRRAGTVRVRVGVRPEELPRRPLRFAEYLYYSGRVGWSDLVEAIAWQRAQRPPLGRIAVELGFLAPEDVTLLLERRREAAAIATPFGEWAVREGFLTRFQLLVVVGQQSRMQRPIGQYFVERGLIDPADVEPVRTRIIRHNSRWR
jgi:hypothetical protein